MTRHFTALSDMGREGVVGALDAADHYLETRGTPEAPRPLEGKSVALVFEKASTRTRVSLEVAVRELGGHPIVISAESSQIARGEPVQDTARVLSRMVHAVTLRTHAHQRLLDMAAASTVPVLNALTDQSHPMQLLADLQTVRRKRGDLTKLVFSWIGDGNNMANTWIEAAGLLGLQLQIACPAGYEPDASEMDRARRRGARIDLSDDPNRAAAGADVINTDVFTSMGQEVEGKLRLKALKNYAVTRKLLGRAHAEVMVLHCLPAHRGEEIETEVFEGRHSHVWDQAEARLHTAKAALEWALLPHA